MKREYLGDSYDAVKRLWQDVFTPWAPLHADSRFIPKEICGEFTALTKIPVLAEDPAAPFSILNDPDTGIRAPSSSNQNEGRTHIALPTIEGQLSKSNVCCVVTFDQSNHRSANLPAVEQRTAKMQWLNSRGLFTFYYVSHAPFLFAFSTVSMMAHAESLLSEAGIPSSRLEHAP